MKKIEYIIKHNLIVQRIYKLVFSMFFRMLSIFIKSNKHRVIFQSMIGKTYSDSPRVIYEEMLKNKKYKNYEFVWAFDDPNKFDVPEAKKVKLNSINYFIETLKCGIWITNVDIERGLKYKPKKTIYINTWHGVTLKYLGNSQKNRNDYDYSDVDFLCSSCEYLDNIFINDFKAKKESLARCGMPRNDVLYNVNKEKINDIKEELNIPKNKKIILYAPTWRDSNDGGQNYVIKPPIDIEYFRKKLGKDYIILFRMHHLTTKQLGLKFDDFVRDCSGKFDINDLMMISDILISDYSATIFDYSILEKPIILFAYDYEEYKNARGLYLDLEDIMPNNVFKKQEDVIDCILKMDYEEECKKTKKLKKKYMLVDGTATKQCMKYLENKEKLRCKNEK